MLGSLVAYYIGSWGLERSWVEGCAHCPHWPLVSHTLSSFLVVVFSQSVQPDNTIKGAQSYLRDLMTLLSEQGRCNCHNFLNRKTEDWKLSNLISGESRDHYVVVVISVHISTGFRNNYSTKIWFPKLFPMRSLLGSFFSVFFYPLKDLHLQG